MPVYDPSVLVLALSIVLCLVLVGPLSWPIVPLQRTSRIFAAWRFLTHQDTLYFRCHCNESSIQNAEYSLYSASHFELGSKFVYDSLTLNGEKKPRYRTICLSAMNLKDRHYAGGSRLNFHPIFQYSIYCYARVRQLQVRRQVRQVLYHLWIALPCWLRLF